MNGRLDVNVALNRPSYQVSTYSNNHASFGNDGNKGTDVYNTPCACTINAVHPWWSVDLGVALNVYGVKYTSTETHGVFVVILLHI